jgi:ABC-type uncharacterized transport system substrate-binding protein
MRRREFIALIGGAAVTLPIGTRAQQGANPIVGFLNPASARAWASYVAAFLQGLKEVGYIDGRNVEIEYRWAEGHSDRLPTLAAELVRRQVNVIAATGGTISARAAKSATSAIPIVFLTADDPVTAGLVARFDRPGGNITGVSFLGGVLMAKNLELLHEMVPSATVIALLVNPKNPNTKTLVKDAHAAATTLGKKIHVLNASTERDIDKVFATLVQERIGALILGIDPVFNARRNQLVVLAAHFAIPTIYYLREYVTAGGLMSYGTNIAASYRLVGTYVGRILNREKPAELPIQRSTKVELVINVRTAKSLGLTIPASLLARADEVIE